MEAQSGIERHLDVGGGEQVLHQEGSSVVEGGAIPLFSRSWSFVSVMESVIMSHLQTVLLRYLKLFEEGQIDKTDFIRIFLQEIIDHDQIDHFNLKFIESNPR